ncbi:MAG: hypothetical protein DRG59_07965 [Deltaproteobacteria bacterium]|nr:MAG: hypothetical protein DRG59_07965 [Deltaproteobacteria bacterium]
MKKVRFYNLIIVLLIMITGIVFVSTASAYRTESYMEGYRAGYYGFLAKKKTNPNLTTKEFYNEVWEKQKELGKPYHYYVGFKDGVRDAVRRTTPRPWLKTYEESKSKKK